VLDLTPEMTKIGAYFQRNLEQNIHKQTDINGVKFSRIAPSTARARASILGANKNRVKLGASRGVVPTTGKKRKSVAGSVSLNRLLFSGNFVHNAFKSEPRKEEVRVYCNPSGYPGEDVSYADIVRYNNRGSSAVNRYIINPPAVFPLSQGDVQKLQAYKYSVALLNSPAVMKKIIGREYKKKITISL
jgi:hypothetical protein